MRSFLTFLLTLVVAFRIGFSQEPVKIDSRRELMVDLALVDQLKGSAKHRLHHPTMREIVIEHDAPWEGGGSNYHTVFQDGDLYRLYYRGADFGLDNGIFKESHPQFTCYAESRDGINWIKPELGLHEFEGSKKNNIILTTDKSTHNFAPFKDSRPGVPDDEKYKAIASFPGKKGLATYVSPDGINWRMLSEEPIITEGAFDSQNLAFWDSEQQEYRAYYRDFRKGFRDIRTSISKDFRTWEGGEWLDYGDSPQFHLYTNQIQPCPGAPHLLIGLPTRYADRGSIESIADLPDPEHRKIRTEVKSRYGTAVTDLMLMTSRDRSRFSLFNEAFLRPGPERPGTWNYGHIYTACGMVKTAAPVEGMPDELTIYGVENAWQSAKMRRYTIRQDGFASIHADYEVGEVRTHPFIFSGKELRINFASSAIGYVKVALTDENGKGLVGAEYGDGIMIGDAINRKVRWKGDPDLSKFAGKPVRLRFTLREADLFAFQFQ